MRILCLALFLALSPVIASADAMKGVFRVRSADCGIKNPLPGGIRSLLVRVGGTKAHVTAYNHPRNPIDPSVGRIAQESGEAYPMVGFPNNKSETVVIKLGPELSRILQRPHLVIGAKIFNPNPETPSSGYLSNPMTEDENIDLWCHMAFEPTTETLDVINPDFVQKAENPSLCAIQFRDPSHGIHSFTHGCTASIIGRRELLTAAHCGKSFADKETRVQCGTDPAWRKISRWSLNPANRPPDHPVANAFDIAVVEMEADLNGAPMQVEADRAATEKMILEGECTHYGMGNRQDGTVGALFRSSYRFPEPFLGGVDYVKTIFKMSNMIASDPMRFMRSGDSGGPIVCRKNGAEVIVGVHCMISVESSAALSAMTAPSWDFIRKHLGR